MHRTLAHTLASAILTLILTSYSQAYPCVCSSHVSIGIYERPSSLTLPLGKLYDSECKARVTDHAYQRHGYFPIMYYGEIAYIVHDAQVKAQECGGSIPTEDRLTTSIPPSTVRTTTTTKAVSLPPSKPPMTMSTLHSQVFTQHVQTTTRPTRASTPSVTLPPSATTVTQPHCIKLALLSDIALHRNVGSPSLARCPDGITHGAEGALAVFCRAPDNNSWKKGKLVLSGCMDGTAPLYSPVAVFDGQGMHIQGAGILVACGSDYTFTIASQKCSEHVTLTKFDTHNQNSFKYYLLNW